MNQAKEVFAGDLFRQKVSRCHSLPNECYRRLGFEIRFGHSREESNLQMCEREVSTRECGRGRLKCAFAAGSDQLIFVFYLHKKEYKEFRSRLLKMTCQNTEQGQVSGKTEAHPQQELQAR